MSENHDISRLLVPVVTEALVVRCDGIPCVDLAPRFDRLGVDGRVLGADIAPDPFSPDASRLEAGVHLHWTLPAELRHGVESDTVDEASGTHGELVFPPVPNRWVVLRYRSDDPADERARAAWLVESDHVDAGTGTSAWLAESADGRRLVPTRIGRALALERCPSAAQAPPTVLRAVGPGNPVFASFYPSCRNVFGFHDALAGLEPGRYSYVVCGWYACAEDDPLHPEDPHGRREDFLARWWPGNKKDEGETGDDAPAASLFHGAVFAVEWNPGGKDDGTGEVDAKVAVGNTLVEAASALIRHAGASEAAVEPLLTAFQYGMLSNPNVRPGVEDLHAALHARRFVPSDAGTCWEIRRNEVHPDAGGPGVAEQRPALAAEAGTRLDELNGLQAGFDRLQRRLASRQADYYEGWCLSRRDPAAFAPSAANALADEIEGLRRKSEGLQKAIIGAALSLRSLQGLVGEKPPYRLSAEEPPRFWRPSEPAVLVECGEDTSAELRVQAQGRLFRETVSAWSFSSESGWLEPSAGGEYTVTGERLNQDAWFSAMPALGGPAPGREIAALYREALLLDPAVAPAIVREAFKLAGLRSPNRARVEALARALDPRRQAPPAGETASPLRGRLPAGDALRGWRSQAWRPVVAAWQALWRTDREPDGEDGCFEPADHCELCVAAETQAPAPPLRYGGWSPLSEGVAENLGARLADLPGDFSHVIRGKGLIGFQLSGLHAAMLQRDQSLVLPPLRIGQEGEILVDASVEALAGNGYEGLPRQDEAGGFFPLRSGWLNLDTLALIDIYGRRRTVPVSGACAAPLVAGPCAAAASPRAVHLPPRLLQPARLHLRWMAASRDTESHSDPGTSPILAWVVPDPLGGSLSVYSADGVLLAVLQRVQTASGVAVSLHDVMPQGRGDGRVGAFARALAQAGHDALEQLLALIERVSIRIAAGGGRPPPSLTALVGRPLALARVRIGLELAGPPLRRPDAPYPGPGMPPEITVPARLGDLRLERNGLVGCFVGEDFTRFVPAFGADLPGHSRFMDPEGTLGLRPDAPPIDVVALIDPRGVFHARCGLMPDASLELRQEWMDEALERLQLAFAVGPVLLADEDRPRLPLPEDVAGGWQWLPAGAASPVPVDKAQGGAVFRGEAARIVEGRLMLSGAFADLYDAKTDGDVDSVQD